ncbi:MAG: serine protease [Thermoanaerobaculia bacterium]
MGLTTKRLLGHRLPALLLALVLAAPAGAGDAGPYTSLLAEAEALVTVKFVLNVKMQGMSADREIESEIACLLIDAEGLILCSNTELGGYVGLMSRMAGGGGFNVSATPKEIKVVVGDATEGLSATLLVRDSDRDLAWLRLAEELEEPLPFLDLSRSAELEVGDAFYRLRRMDKFFGRAPMVEEGIIAAVTDKPRKLLVPSSPAAAGSGLPVFTADGRVVGVTVVQMPSLEDAATATQGGMGFLGAAAQMQDMVGGLILPVADVVKATRLAREIAAEDDGG